MNYIQNNLADNGVLYILGGNVAVPEYIEKELQNDGIKCVRLSGTTRYETNIAILKEAGIKAGQEILIATGNEFADSLSASATGLPILLVSNALTELQMEYLQSVSGSKLTIIGGTNAVSAELEEVLSQYGTVSRISGADRYATSVAVAECYFEEPEAILLAYGRNFPDGLCGGPLGYIMGAPLLLVQDGNEKNAADYVAKYDVVSGIVLGGTAVVSDKTVAAVF